MSSWPSETQDSKITTDFVTNIILCTLIKIYSFFILLPNTSLTVVIFQPAEFFVCCSFDCFIYLKCVTVVSVLLQIAIGRELGLDLMAKVFERNPEIADVRECPSYTF